MEQLKGALDRIPNLDSRLQHQFFYALEAFNKGKTAAALPMLHVVLTTDANWREIARHLALMYPDDPFAQQLDSILSQ